MNNRLLEQLGLLHPIIQAPMAGVATPELAAAVSQAGGLGSLGLGANTPDAARKAIGATQALTDRPINANCFCHARPVIDETHERYWLELLAPAFAEFDAAPPGELQNLYTSFRDNDEMLAVLLEARVPVASFHFGVPTPEQIKAMKQAGIFMLGCATSLEEARSIADAGLDAIIAQGIEAGGHRGCFDPGDDVEQLGTLELTRQIATALALPVIAAGGIMDGKDIRAATEAGAVAAQLGTAFVSCPESAADDGYRSAIDAASDKPDTTRLTAAISGRPARCLVNRFTAWADDHAHTMPPAYPRSYAAGKALSAAASACGEYGFGAHWAGMNVGRSRSMPAAELMRQLVEESARA
ncbi:MAG: nitronate monooxygenase [Gammaproteobacteria bacterium]|nr:MAG: nitronate monooxygenase [Gammaproteobacteria bacterium]